MTERFEQGSEFLRISGQIAKNIEAFRNAGMLAYANEQFALNTSRVVCEIISRGVEENSLTFNINAFQETESSVDPKPRLVLKQDAALSDDLNSFLEHIDLNQLVLSAIANHRLDIHALQEGTDKRQIAIARAKSSPHGIDPAQLAEEQENASYLQLYKEQLEWLDVMEAKAMHGEPTVKLRSIPSAVLLAVDVTFE